MLNKTFLIICLGLILLNITIYGQTLSHNMVYDEEKDAAVIFQDGLTVPNLKKVFIESVQFYTLWEPVAFFTSMLGAELFGNDPGPRHMINLFLHIASTLLLFVCFRKMTAAIWPSALVAALFAAHPVNVEAVAWLAFHDSSLNLFFISLSLLAYIQYTRTASRLSYALLIATFLCSMLACPRIMAFPFLLLFLDYWPLDRRPHHSSAARPCRGKFQINFYLREKIPLFAIAFIYSAIMILVKYRHPDMRSVNIEYLDILVSYAAYIVKIFLPASITANRYMCPFHPSAWQIIASAGFLLLISGLIMMTAGKNRRYLVVGWLWFLFALAPAVIMNAGKHFIITERYAYLGSIGIFIIIAFGLKDMVAARRLNKTTATLIATIMLVFFTVTAWQHTRYWKDSLTLLESTIRRLPEELICHDTAGGIFLENNRIRDAIRHFQTALRRQPESPSLHLNLGIAYQADNALDKSLRHLKKAVSLDPENAKAYHNLGNVLFESGEIDQATDCYKKALRINPEAYQTYNSLATCLARRGEIRKATACLEKALEINPEYRSARENLRILQRHAAE
ncbi:MAG: tetratricopeptide repeat protein [Desulfosudaceae bacterium]